MYEIWLMLNILWEIVRGVWPALALLFVVWLALLVAARARLCAGRRVALLVGAIVAVLAFLALPSLTGSSLGEMRYWVDWASLAGMALGFGLAAGLFALPFAGLWHRRAHPI